MSSNFLLAMASHSVLADQKAMKTSTTDKGQAGALKGAPQSCPAAAPPATEAPGPSAWRKLTSASRSSPQVLAPGGSQKPRRCSRAWEARTRRQLEILQAGLAALSREERQEALERLPSSVRQALLLHMTSSKSASGQQSQPMMGESLATKVDLPAKKEKPPNAEKLPAKRCWDGDQTTPGGCKRPSPPGPRDATRVAAPAPEGQPRSHSGVRAVPTALFQASVSFDHLLIRSRTCRSYDGAKRLCDVLHRFRDLAGPSCAKEDVEDLPEGGWLRSGLSRALKEAGIEEEDLKPSYCAVVSTGVWAGRIETPTTASLEQVQEWRDQLLKARLRSWEEFRSAWIAILQEPRPGGSSPLQPDVAAARVDAAAARRRLPDPVAKAKRRAAAAEARRKAAQERMERRVRARQERQQVRQQAKAKKAASRSAHKAAGWQRKVATAAAGLLQLLVKRQRPSSSKTCDLALRAPSGGS